MNIEEFKNRFDGNGLGK